MRTHNIRTLGIGMALGASLAVVLMLVLQSKPTGAYAASTASIESRFQIASVSPGEGTSIYHAFVVDCNTGEVYALLTQSHAAHHDEQVRLRNHN